jgi:polysaccharide chain length determinant protein (PEP-CTERM system associated)
MQDVIDLALSYLKATWRYRWYAVVVAWIVALVGWTVVQKMPDRYVAFARVYVDTQTVLRPLLSGLAVQPDVSQLVPMMTRTLITRPNLEKLLQITELDKEFKSAEDRERLFAVLRREIAIRGAGKENLYTIAYTDQNPQHAKRIVQGLVTIFTEGNLGDKRKDSDSARQFIEEQLKGYGEKLVAAENAVTEFQRKHQGHTPGAGGRDYYARLSEASIALKRATLELKEAENSRDAIKRQLAGDAEISLRLGDKGSAVRGQSVIDTRIQGLEQKLDSLRLNYTDQHPDIVALLRILAQLKEQRMEEDALRKSSGGAALSQGPVYQQLTVALASAEATVAAMKARVAEYSARYSELQAAANALPQIEAEYKQLTRDYDVIKRRYDSLAERRESAQISGDLEASDVVMGFRVVEPARVPLTPSSPNRLRLISMVLAAALAAGFGVAFLLSQFRPTFNEERRLRDVSGLPVLGTVVMAWTDAQQKRLTRGRRAIVASFLGLIVAYGAIMGMVLAALSRA